MSFSLAQRRARLQRRSGELEWWRIIDRSPVEGWTFEGAPIALGAAWPSAEGVQRLFAHAELPAGWPLEESRLKLDLGGESFVTLAYDDGGAESFGLDPNHRELPLKGRRFAISSESVARAPFGQPVNNPSLAEAALIHVDLAIERLLLLLTLIAETVEALEDDEVSALLLDAAEAALRGLDWPSSTQEYIARTARSRQQRTIWRLPGLVSHPPGLTDRERASVVAAHQTLIASLDDLKRRFPPRGKIALSGHAHIDLAWLWPYEETRRKLRRTFHTALSLIERNPAFRFNQSTAHYYEQIERDDAKLFARIRDSAKNGAGSQSAACGSNPTPTCRPAKVLRASCSMASATSARDFGKRPQTAGCPIVSASRRRCRNC